MDDFALTPAERRLFAALRSRGVRFLIIGMGAAGLEREIEGVTLRILPLARVITSKRATGRPKDAASLPALEATLHAKESST